MVAATWWPGRSNFCPGKPCAQLPQRKGLRHIAAAVSATQYQQALQVH
jgi:hypothetical protein